MMWIHAWRIGQISRWLDTAREEQDEVGDELDSEVSDEDEADEEDVIEEEVAGALDDTELDIPPPITADDDVELVDID
jgi:hypothetical protein